MDLDRLLGIEAGNELDRQAFELANSDAQLVRDLVELRRRKGLTQTDVATIMGVSQGAVARIEKAGRDPRLSTLRRYAMAVGALISHNVTSAFAADADEAPSGEATQNRQSFQQIFIGSSGVYCEEMTIAAEPDELIKPVGGPYRVEAPLTSTGWTPFDADADWIRATREASESEEPAEAAAL